MSKLLFFSAIAKSIRKTVHGVLEVSLYSRGMLQLIISELDLPAQVVCNLQVLASSCPAVIQKLAIRDVTDTRRTSDAHAELGSANEGTNIFLH